MDLESRIKRLEKLAEKEKIKIFGTIFCTELHKISHEEKIFLIAKHFNVAPCDSLWNSDRIALWYQDLNRKVQKMTPKEIYYWAMEYVHRPIESIGNKIG